MDIIQVENYLDFLTDNKLTQSQGLLLFMISDKNKKELVKRYKKAFPPKDGKVIGEYLEKDLIVRNYMREINGEFLPHKRFKSNFIHSYLAYEELKRVYPDFYQDKGKEYPLKVIDDDEYSLKYSNRIFKSIKNHEKVMHIVEFAKDNNLINISLAKFIDSKYWKVLQKKMESQILDDFNSLNDDF